MWFTQLFLILLTTGLLLELWLLQRHRRSVATHRDQVPQRFRERITLADHRRAADYTLARTQLARIELFYAALLLLGWTLGGGINWLAETTEKLTDSPLLAGLLLILGFLLSMSLLELPFTLYRTFVIEQRFGFNRTTPWQFIKDGLLQLLLTLILGGPLLAAVLWLMESAGRYWWTAAWVLWSLFTLLLLWIYPTLIAPLFNRFKPLPEGELRQRIQQLLQRCGFADNGIFVMDGSRRSGHGNAYFTGLGRNKRIVFFDTLIDALTPQQIEAVLAHELGHHHHHHVQRQIVISLVSSFAGLALLGWLAEQPWFYLGLGVRHPSSATALLLFLLVAPLFSQFLRPLFSALSRHQEYQADAFAASHSGAAALIEALLALYRDNASTLTPDPLYSTFHDSHPPASLRIGRLSATIQPADKRIGEQK